MLRLDQWPEAARTLARTYGARGTVLRAAHEARRALGGFRLTPRYVSRAWDPPEDSPFRADARRLAASTDLAMARDRADRVLAGFHHAYRWDWRPLPATPEEWRRHPVTTHQFSARDQWWTIPQFDPSVGDIKDVWEPARFGWAYDLVRAALVTERPDFADAFRRTFDLWRRSSFPFRGPHWACGQETAIRGIALLYAEANLPPTEGLAEILAASGERIADAIGYAISQRNNHGISEAAGLVALGVRFRDRHPEAARWLQRGRRWLERLIREQFAEDGWYIQHSFTYLRLAIDQCVIAERALRSVGETLPPSAVERLAQATQLLITVMDPETGTVPNHGANDGAFVHPITTATYGDFRPVVTAACAVWRVPLPTSVRACGEVLAWLGVDSPPPAAPLGDGVTSGPSGWAVARAGATQVFLRAGRYSSRPGHLDSLHVDVRFGGREVVVDPGTFAYNAQAPWLNGLAGADVHNGPLLNGRQPGIRGPRFLWYLWPDADLVSADWNGRAATLVAELSGRVRRTVRVTSAGVDVEDRISPGAADEVVVRWLLHPGVHSDAVRVEGESELRDAREGETPGWYSPTYGVRVPSRYVHVRRSARDGATIVTTITSVSDV